MHVVTAIPIQHYGEGDFWGRDAGLMATGFLGAGCRATLVAIGNPDDSLTGVPGLTPELRLASMEAMKTPAFWRQLAPDLVFLFAWTLPRHEGIRRAIRASGIPFIERMDTDGMRSPLLGFRRFFYLSWAQSMSRLKASRRVSWKAIPALASACLWTGRSLIGSPWLGAYSARIASRIPLVVVESPSAESKIRKWLALHGLGSGNVRFLPHPVAVESLPGVETQSRGKRVIAIGRWKSFQKNPEATLAVAGKFLSLRKDYEFHFIGENPHSIQPFERMHFHGLISRQEIGRIAAESRILLALSRYESFHLGAAEALCCGCSVVMAPGIPTAGWFTGPASGTVATTDSQSSYLEALLKEVDQWESGQRDPLAISKHWRKRLNPVDVARETLLDFVSNPLHAANL